VQWMTVPVCLVLAGCASAPEPVEVAPTVTEPQRPTALFPDCFFMEGSELNDQGLIPGSGLIGGDMTMEMDLSAVRSWYNDQLSAHAWTTDKMEIGRQYFRVLASHAGEEIEIRAVQGTGPTQVFILYRPSASQEKK